MTNQSDNSTLTLIIPAYNEEKRLPVFLDSVVEYIQNHSSDISEILLVDDGSTDNTIRVATQYQTKIPTLRILKQPHNQGKGAAIARGVAEAAGNWIVFIDADGATPISELPKMRQALSQAQVAVGNRWMSGADVYRSSLFRHASGWIYKTYMGFFGLGGIDTMCGFKGYHYDVAQELFSNLLEKRWLFDTEVAYKVVRHGYTVKNFPISWKSVEGSKLSSVDLIKSGLHVWPLISRIKKSETI